MKYCTKNVARQPESYPGALVHKVVFSELCSGAVGQNRSSLKSRPEDGLRIQATDNPFKKVGEKKLGRDLWL